MHRCVTSFTLVWIKIDYCCLLLKLQQSRASRSCGLKLSQEGVDRLTLAVTSFTLVWIKIHAVERAISEKNVTSFTLVWIKIRFS